MEKCHESQFLSIKASDPNTELKSTALFCLLVCNSCVHVISHLKCYHKLERGSVFDLGKLHAYHRYPFLASRSNILRYRFEVQTFMIEHYDCDDHQSMCRVVSRFKNSFIHQLVA